MSIVLIKTGQNSYSPEQVADRAITVAELISQLENEDQDAQVVVGGYGCGAVWEPVRRVETYYGEDEDDSFEGGL